MIFEPKKFIFGTFYRDFEGYFRLKYNPVNREQTRALTKEVVIAMEKLLEVDASFLRKLFSNDDHATYEELYVQHLDYYINACEWLIERYKFKWITIDKYYFSKEYKPTEV